MTPAPDFLPAGFAARFAPAAADLVVAGAPFFTKFRLSDAARARRRVSEKPRHA